MMLKKIINWFKTPNIDCAEENKHRIILLNGIINSSIIFVTLVFIGNLFDRNTLLRNYLIDIVLLASFVVFRLFLTNGKVFVAGIGSTVLGFILTTISIMSDGTVRSTAIYLFFFIIIVCGIFYKLVGVILSIIACSAATLIIILAENAALLPTPNYSVSILHWFLLTITFLIVGGIVYFPDHITQKAYKQVKKEIIERQKIESQLIKVNKELRANITEVEKLQQELLEQSIHDALTDLYNRRYMMETLPREIQRALRESIPLSIIIGDVDYFKNINDIFGHHIGDIFLIQIANILRANIRDFDFVCRYGGEEFLIVLPDATIDVAVMRAEEMRIQIEMLEIIHEGKKLHTTMSFGIASYPKNGTQGDALIQNADKALYNAKRMGRNQVKISEA